jgi:GNAT superfamily N-acetyltransferase
MITIRNLHPSDERRWRELWDGYTRFYQREPVDEITAHLWRRLHDPSSPVFALVALATHQNDATVDDQLVGIAHYLLHESTSQIAPVCYLQDLFVDPARRGCGIARLLIDSLISRMKSSGWSRLYWQTKENNHQARALYDTYTPHSGFVKYVIENKPHQAGCPTL